MNLLKSFLGLFAVSTIGFSTLVLASGFQCSDSTGDLTYTSYHSDGGPCCAPSIANLTYKGTVIKSVESAVGPGASTVDSNPNLVISRSPQVDMGNTSKSGNWITSAYAVNITLTTADGSAPVPVAGASSPVTISMICTSSQYAGPPIP